VLWKHWTPIPERKWHAGISWILADANGEQIVMHSGGDDGFTTHLAFAPARRAGVVMMFNCDHVSSIHAIWEAAMGKPPPWPK
jgi:hypothetical protein